MEFKLMTPPFLFVVLFILAFDRLTKRGVSLGHLVLSGLTFVAPPSKQVVATLKPDLSGETNLTSNKRKKMTKGKKDEMPLVFERVRGNRFVGVPFFSTFDNVMSLGFIVVVSFFFGEVWCCVFGARHHSQEAWVVFAAVNYLCVAQSAAVVHAGWCSDKVKSALIAGVVAFSLTLGILVKLPAHVLPRNFEAAWEVFKDDFNAEMAHLGVEWRLGGSVMGVYFALAALGGWCGYLFFWPALRFAQLHNYVLAAGDVNDFSTGGRATSRPFTAWTASNFTKFLVHLNSVSPLLVAVLWFPAVTDIFRNSKTGINVLSDEGWVVFRVSTALMAAFLRLLLLRHFIQGYFHSTWINLRKLLSEGINQTTATACKRLLSRVLEVAPLVALESVVPSLLLLLTSLLYKRNCDLRWGVCSALDFPGSPVVPAADKNATATSTAAGRYSISMDFVLHPLSRESLSFLVWLLHLLWFLWGMLGLLYVRKTQSMVSLVNKKKS